MMHTDFVDALAALSPASRTYKARHERGKIVEATQASLTALFDPALPGLPLETRYLVAILACRLSGEPAMADAYKARLVALPHDETLLAHVERGALAAIAAAETRAALGFAETLITRPVEGDKAAIAALKAAGLGDEGIVLLGQLIGFLSYQTRLVAGLRVLSAAEGA